MKPGVFALILAVATGTAGAPPFATGQDRKDTFERWSEFYRTVRTGLRNDDVREQLAAVERFKDQDYPEAAEYLVELIERRNPSSLIARRAAEILGAYQDATVRDRIADAVRKDPAGSRYLLLAFVAQPHPEANTVALKALQRARSPATAAVAIEAIGRLPDQAPETVATLVDRLKPENYHTVRRAAADSLGRIRSAAGVPALIDSLDDKLLAESARDALLRLTGESHWTDAAAWSAWWTRNSANFTPEMLEDAEFEKRHAELLEKFGDGTGGGMAAEFYGKKLTGKNILFLLDSSGSMTTDERMDRLKRELSFMIEQMSEAYRFGLIMFPLDTFPARGIDAADQRMKERAGRFIDRIRPNGGTPMGEALKFAFEKIVPKENVDTIYLLSDGVPTDVIPNRLQDVILEFNEPLGVSIHTIWVGGDGRELLQKIAAENAGQFWEAP